MTRHYCKTCDWGVFLEYLSQGTCHKKSPEMDEEFNAEWPIVSEDHYCGEHSALQRPIWVETPEPTEVDRFETTYWGGKKEDFPLDPNAAQVDLESDPTT